jgi:hypothetical protein
MKPMQSDIFVPRTREGRPDLIQDTIRFWEGRFGRQVTPEEAREMIENVVGYFSLLAEWDSAKKDIMNSDDSRG